MSDEIIISLIVWGIGALFFLYIHYLALQKEPKR